MPIISGGGGGAAFNGGTITDTLTVDTAALTIPGVEISGTGTTNATRLWVDYPHTSFYVTDDGVVEFAGDDQVDLNVRSTSAASGAVHVFSAASGNPRAELRSDTGLTYSTGGSVVAALGPGVLKTNPPTPGTQAFASGTGAQISTSLDVRTFTPVTFNPTAGAAATCAVAIGYPPTPTYVTLWTETEPAGLAFDGTIHGINVYVPAGWFLKLTVVNATLGTTTYY